MIVRLLLILTLLIISLFCWLSFTDPMDVEFFFFGQTVTTDLPTLMITSFVLGALLVFVRAHAAIDLKKLKAAGVIDERLSHVRRGKARRKVYFLTMAGKAKAAV